MRLRQTGTEEAPRAHWNKSQVGQQRKDPVLRPDGKQRKRQAQGNTPVAVAHRRCCKDGEKQVDKKYGGGVNRTAERLTDMNATDGQQSTGTPANGRAARHQQKPQYHG